MNKSGSLDAVSRPLAGFRDTVGQASGKVPTWVWIITLLACGTTICLFLYLMNKSGSLEAVSRPLAGLRDTAGLAAGKVPTWVWIIALLALPSAIRSLPDDMPRTWPPTC